MYPYIYYIYPLLNRMKHNEGSAAVILTLRLCSDFKVHIYTHTVFFPLCEKPDLSQPSPHASALDSTTSQPPPPHNPSGCLLLFLQLQSPSSSLPSPRWPVAMEADWKDHSVSPAHYHSILARRK